MKSTTSRRILVIDDNVDLATVLSALLGTFDYEAEAVYSGPEGLAAMSTFVPHVVLCDIGMPLMLGYDVAIEIRRMKILPPPLLISMSGWGDAATVRRSAESGFDIHLVKPLSVELYSVILSDYFKTIEHD